VVLVTFLAINSNTSERKRNMISLGKSEDVARKSAKSLATWPCLSKALKSTGILLPNYLYLQPIQNNRIKRHMQLQVKKARIHKSSHITYALVVAQLSYQEESAALVLSHYNKYGLMFLERREKVRRRRSKQVRS
jgi:hypothetical protein